VLYHTLTKIPNENFKITEVNFFAPCHGKSDCDAHFSFLGNWFDELERTTETKNNHQVISYWNHCINIRNNEKKHKKNFQPLDVVFEEYFRNLRPTKYTQLNIVGNFIKKYFSWKKENNKLLVKKLSQQLEVTKIPSLTKITDDSRKDKYPPNRG